MIINGWDGVDYKLYTYSGWRGTLLSSKTITPYVTTSTYHWMVTDGTDNVYIAGSKFLIKWTISTDRINYVNTAAVGHDFGQPAQGLDGKVYTVCPVGLDPASLFRYSFSDIIAPPSFTEERWDGRTAIITRPDYITVTGPGGPTMLDIMRHGKWFGGGTFQGFWLGWRS
jgi:hypothetical protein